MKVQIPDIGDKLTLAADWTFHLFHEDRNKVLWEIFDKKKFTYSRDKIPGINVKLPKGTVLSVERVYIRKGSKDFSSLSFRIVTSPNSDINKARFFAKLKDVNQMLVTSIEISNVLPLDFKELSFIAKGYRYRIDENQLDYVVSVHKDSEEIPVFNISLDVTYLNKSKTDSAYESAHRTISNILYIVKNSNNNEIFRTSSFENVKKRCKEIYKKLCEEEISS